MHALFETRAAGKPSFSIYEKLDARRRRTRVRIYIPQIPSATSLCANTRCPKCRSRRWDGVVLRCDAYRMQERILDLHVDSAQAGRAYRRMGEEEEGGWRRPNTLQGVSALGARIENQDSNLS